MSRRACIECDHMYNGVLTCPKCGGAGEPLPQGRPRGRPPVDDKRTRRVGMNADEWARVQEMACAAGYTSTSKWVRERLGL